MKAFKINPPRMPTQSKKAQRLQRQRREQLKYVVNDISRIATKEIERFNDFANELLTEEADNPIILEEREEEDEEKNEISI